MRRCPSAHTSTFSEARGLVAWRVALVLILSAVVLAATGCAGSSSQTSSTSPSPIVGIQEVPTGPLVTIAPGLSRYTNRRLNVTFDITTSLLRPNNAYLTALAGGKVALLYVLTDRVSTADKFDSVQVSAKTEVPPQGAARGDASVLASLLAKLEAFQAKEYGVNRLIAGRVTKVNGWHGVFVSYRLAHKSGVPNRDLFAYQLYGTAGTYGVSLVVRSADVKRCYPAFLTTVRSLQAS